jgi:hypothetical protein
VRFQLRQPSSRIAEAPNVSASLINDWASRVTELAELDGEELENVEPAAEFESACLVRDQLNNQLDVTHVDATASTEKSMKRLRSADALFRRITVQSDTASTLSAHNHYARLSEWWWRRVLRRQV